LIQIVWDLNLKRPINFKSKTYPLIPLMGHQPTGHCSPSPADLFPFLTSFPARHGPAPLAQPEQPKRTRARPTDHHRPPTATPHAPIHLSPGRLMSGPCQSAFLFLLRQSRPEASAPPAALLPRAPLRPAAPRSAPRRTAPPRVAARPALRQGAQPPRPAFPFIALLFPLFSFTAAPPAHVTSHRAPLVPAPRRGSEAAAP
jgi:hypothetical protein